MRNNKDCANSKRPQMQCATEQISKQTEMLKPLNQAIKRPQGIRRPSRSTNGMKVDMSRVSEACSDGGALPLGRKPERSKSLERQERPQSAGHPKEAA